jgi:FMN phosphatase YigB (HAD superfamily)
MQGGDVKFETVFLDAGGVLVHPRWDLFASMLHDQGLHAEEAALAVAELRCTRELDDGALVTRTDDRGRVGLFFRRTAELAGVEVTGSAWSRALDAILAWHERHNLWGFVPEDVVPALDALRGAGRRLVVVSNAGGTVRRKLAEVGLAHQFVRVFDSHEEGVEKPDRRYFELAMAHTGALPGSTVHVGDFYHIDVVGARNAGLPAVLLDRAGLHADRDAPRIRSLRELPGLLAAWEAQSAS